MEKERSIMKRVLILVAILSATVSVSYSQGGGSTTPKQVQAGEVVPFGDTVFVKVVKASKQFAGVKVNGEAFVAVLEMEAVRAGASVFFNVSADPASTDIYLMSGAKKLAPRAVIEDFPSWGNDNDKEVEILDPKDKLGGTTLNFQRQGSVALLFDVPVEEAKTQKKLSVAMRMVQPKDEQRSFIVTL